MNNSQCIGNFSNNNIQNIVNISQMPLIPSVIFKLLECVKKFEAQNNEQFELKKPAGLREKLQFNNANRYISKFSEEIYNYALLDRVLKDEFPDSERVVENVKYIFKDCVSVDEDGNPTIDDGDSCLQKMHDDIKDRLARDPDFLSSGIDDFDLDKFITALLQYGVIECQILLNPNNYKENNNVIAW